MSLDNMNWLTCSLVGESDSISTDDTDALMAKELTHLSIEERERVFEEVHGVAQIIEESEGFVARKLEQLEEEIGKCRRKRAYEQALFLNPEYAQNMKFRLMFLRADRFDPSKAAKRVIKFFELKLDLFGINKLVKDITMDDLNTDDLVSLNAGSHFFLKNYDRAGRRILLCTMENETYVTYRNMVRRMGQFASTYYSILSGSAETYEFITNLLF